MRNIFYLLAFISLTNSAFAQVKPFKITASADIPSLLLVKRPDLVSETVDTVNVLETVSRLSIRVDEPRSAILETDQQQVMIWLIPGYTLDVKIVNNQLVFGGQAAIYADYYQNKQNNFINFCHYYYQRNPSFNEAAQDYMNFLDSVTLHQARYFKKYFTNNKSLYIKQFMEQEMASIYYENLSRKLLYGDYSIEKFKSYQKLNDVQSAAFYSYSDKASFTNKDFLKIHFFQQFAGQFVNVVALKKQKERSAEFIFSDYLAIAMQTIEKLTGSGPTMHPIKAIFIARVIEEMERTNKTEWEADLDKLLSSLLQTSGNNQFLLLKEKMYTLQLNQKN